MADSLYIAILEKASGKLLVSLGLLELLSRRIGRVGFFRPITPGDERDDDLKLFHAGTVETKDGHIVTHGGRVLCATALGDTVAEAQHQAYNLVKQVSWEGMYCRTDIGYRAIARERGE